MDVVAQDGGALQVLRVQGRIDQLSANSFSEKLAPWLTRCADTGKPLLLDFSGVDYISSVGLRVLQLAAKQLKPHGVKVGIAALTPVVAEVFKIARFNLVVPVFADVDSASAQLQ